MSSSDLAACLNHVWQSTLCAATAWLLTIALRKNRAAIRYWLWFAASVKFLVPFSLLVSLGSQIEWRTAPSSEHVNVLPLISFVSHPTVTPHATLSVGLPPIEALPIVLFYLWLCGFALHLILWLRCRYKIRAACRAATFVAIDFPAPVLMSRSLLGPAVIGIWKPVVLLPEGIVEHLTPIQLEMILAHELSHVRRHDNLTGAVHMLVEMLFWFYPVTWWIRAQLLVERERACDEEVCSQHYEPEAYAQSVLSVCQFYVQPPPMCAAGAGSGLRRRIEAIVTRPIAARLSFGKRLVLASAATLAIALPITLGVLNAPPIEAASSAPWLHSKAEPIMLSLDAYSSRPQSFTLPRVRLETASIRLSNDRTFAGAVLSPDGHLTANGPLRFLIEDAYGMRRDDIVGGPPWIDSDMYRIDAKAPGNASKAQTERGLQALLRERFGIKIHRESKAGETYALTLGNSGALNRIVNGGCCAPAGFIRTSAYPGFVWLHGDGVAISDLVKHLAPFLDRPLVNRTRFTGSLNIDLQFFVHDSAKRGGSIYGESRPNIFDAVQERLGLKIERDQGTDFRFVIDRVERPAAN